MTLHILYKNHFLQLFERMNVSERRRVREALVSPFFNKNEFLKRLYSFVEKQHHLFKDDLTFKEAAHKHVFGKAEYEDVKIRRLLSELLKIAEQVLVFDKIKEDNAGYKIELLEVYRKFKLEKHYKKIATDAENLFQTTTPRNLELYYKEYKLLQETETFYEEKEGRRSSTRLQEVSDTLDNYYFLHKLKMACASMSYQHMFQSKFEIGMVEEIKGYLSKQESKDPLINLYFLGFQTLTDEQNEAHFNLLKQKLNNRKTEIARSELRDLHVLAQNYCIRKVNRGKPEYFRELLELYMMGLEQGLLQYDSSQFPPAYKNIVAVALQQKQYAWLEQFIQQYSGFIEPEYQPDYINFSMARLHFEKGEYEKAEEYLNKMVYKDFFIGLNARMLVVKNYYELGMDTLLSARLESFQQYLGRKGMMAYHKENYLNNLKFTKRLINLNKYDAKRKGLLKSQIQGQNSLTEKQWLLEKLEEL